MSAFLKNKIVIKVTKGDCLELNRMSGKSNSATYFVSQLKDFLPFEKFFDMSKPYYFSKTYIYLYGILFKECFSKYKDNYLGKMNFFDEYLKIFVDGEGDVPAQVMIRPNDKDNRIFFRFKDNFNKYSNAFRNLLYENLSLIAIEDIGHCYLIYPEIVADDIFNKKSELVFTPVEE